MFDPHAPRLRTLQRPPTSLYKQKSWSPDIYRDEAWQQRRKAVGKRGGRMKQRSKSVTDDDLDELKACIELGFGFDSPEAEFDRKLSDTLPALGLYYAVNNQYKNDTVSRSSTPSSECGSPGSQSSQLSIFDQGDNPQTMRTRLKQWAQVVACSVRQI
ncbi:hypothetical protein ACFE04_022980 [Oxalis oulophora]